jgi:hypothetical protein
MNVDGHENGKTLVRLCALSALCAIPFSWRPLRDDLIHPLICAKRSPRRWISRGDRIYERAPRVKTHVQ